jgi:GGDEF domain-containing protein
MLDIRKTDTLARTRDNGFTWLVEGLAAINDISALIDRLPTRLSMPFSIDDRDVCITASVGVAICPFHGCDFPMVHAMAEAAMLDVATVSGDGLLMLPLPAFADKASSASITA